MAAIVCWKQRFILGHDGSNVVLDLAGSAHSKASFTVNGPGIASYNHTLPNFRSMACPFIIRHTFIFISSPLNLFP